MKSVYLSRGGRGTSHKIPWDATKIQRQLLAIDPNLEFVTNSNKAEYAVIPDGAVPLKNLKPDTEVMHYSNFYMMLKRSYKKASIKKTSAKKTSVKQKSKKSNAALFASSDEEEEEEQVVKKPELIFGFGPPQTTSSNVNLVPMRRKEPSLTPIASEPTLELGDKKPELVFGFSTASPKPIVHLVPLRRKEPQLTPIVQEPEAVESAVEQVLRFEPPAAAANVSCTSILANLRAKYKEEPTLTLDAMQQAADDEIMNGHKELAKSFANLVISKNTRQKNAHKTTEEEDLDSDPKVKRMLEEQKKTEDAIDTLYNESWAEFNKGEDNSDEALDAMLDEIEEDVTDIMREAKTAPGRTYLKELAKELWSFREGYSEADVQQGQQDLVVQWLSARDDSRFETFKTQDLNSAQEEFSSEVFSALQEPELSLDELIDTVVLIANVFLKKYKSVSAFRDKAFNSDLKHALIDDYGFSKAKVQAKINKLWQRVKAK